MDQSEHGFDNRDERLPVTHSDFCQVAAEATHRNTVDWQGANPEYDALLAACAGLKDHYIDYRISPTQVYRFHGFGDDLFSDETVLQVLLTAQPKRAVEIVENRLQPSVKPDLADNYAAAGNEVGAIFDNRQWRLPISCPQLSPPRQATAEILKLAA